MFRDSRGVVHTVSSADPLADLPPDAAEALRSALLRTDEPDLGSALERCDAVQALLAQWQEVFFASLPEEVDLAEEARWAAEAGLSLEEVEAGFEDDLDLDLETDLDTDLDPSADPALPDDDDPTALLLGGAPDDEAEDARALLAEDLVGRLERELLLLPLRVRLEALVAAETLVITWSELLADHEKLLGHLVLAHDAPSEPHGHEDLAARHAALHAAGGPGHPQG